MAARRGASIARWFLDWFKSIAIALVVWLFLRTFVVEAFTIPSGSMKNTLLVGDFLFVNKFLYGAEVPLIHKRLPMVREPQRGDILVFDSIEEDMKIVKRLIGIPGDTIEMRGGVVYRNGAPLDGAVRGQQRSACRRRRGRAHADARLAGEALRRPGARAGTSPTCTTGDRWSCRPNRCS